MCLAVDRAEGAVELKNAGNPIFVEEAHGFGDGAGKKFLR